MRLWLLGFPATVAWRFALSVCLDWHEHLPAQYLGRLDDGNLAGAFLRRRLCDIVKAEDGYVEMAEADRSAAGQVRP